MRLIDDVLKGDLYQKLRSNLSDEEKQECDKYLRDNLKNLEALHDTLKLKMSDNTGRVKILDDLLYLFNSEEGHKKWQEKN